jgi:hypothetical protein
MWRDGWLVSWSLSLFGQSGVGQGWYRSLVRVRTPWAQWLRLRNAVAPRGLGPGLALGVSMLGWR